MHPSSSGCNANASLVYCNAACLGLGFRSGWRPAGKKVRGERDRQTESGSCTNGASPSSHYHIIAPNSAVLRAMRCARVHTMPCLCSSRAWNAVRSACRLRLPVLPIGKEREGTGEGQIGAACAFHAWRLVCSLQCTWLYCMCVAFSSLHIRVLNGG